MDWAPEKVYDLIGSLIAAKEKQREDGVDAQSMGDFVSSFFEEVYVKKTGSGFDRTLTQKTLSEFARAVQAHWAHPDLGPRIHLFGLLSGLLLFEGDHPSLTPAGSFGASTEACLLILDSLRAVLNKPKFVLPALQAKTLRAALKGVERAPPAPTTRPSMTSKHGVSSKKVRRGGQVRQFSEMTAVARHAPASPSSASSSEASFSPSSSSSRSSSSSSSSSTGQPSNHNDLEYEDEEDDNEEPYPSVLERALKLRRSGPLACCVVFQRDAKRRAQRCTAVQEYERDRMRSHSHQQQRGQRGGLPLVSQRERLSRLLGGADDSHLPSSTVEGRLRQVLEAQKPEMPVGVVDSLCDTLWAEALQLRELVVARFARLKTADREDAALPNIDGLDDPLEAPIQVDRLLVAVLSAFLAVRVVSPQELPRPPPPDGNAAAAAAAAAAGNTGPRQQLQASLPASLSAGDGSAGSAGGSFLNAKLESVREGNRRNGNGNSNSGGGGGQGGQDMDVDDDEHNVAGSPIDGDDERESEAEAAAAAALTAKIAAESAAGKEAERRAWQEKKRSDKAALELAEKGERIGYQEASAVAFDWGLAFDGQCREVSFEEARHMYRRIRNRPSVTLSVRLLSRLKTAAVTVRCAPSDTVRSVKRKVVVEQQHSSSGGGGGGGGGSARGGKGRLAGRQGARPESSSSFHPPQLAASEDDFVMVQCGVEMAPEFTIEACGLHNNASVEMMELVMWRGILKQKLDQPASTRSKGEGAFATANAVNAAAAAATEVGGGGEEEGGGSGGDADGGGVRGVDPAPRPAVRLVTRVLLGAEHHADQGGVDVNPEVLKALVALTAKASTATKSSSKANAKEGTKATASVSNAMEILRLQLRNGDRKWKPPK